MTRRKAVLRLARWHRLARWQTRWQSTRGRTWIVSALQPRWQSSRARTCSLSFSAIVLQGSLPALLAPCPCTSKFQSSGLRGHTANVVLQAWSHRLLRQCQGSLACIGLIRTCCRGPVYLLSCSPMHGVCTGVMAMHIWHLACVQVPHAVSSFPTSLFIPSERC